MDTLSASKRLEIARWFYRRALSQVRAESNAVTWAALLRAAQNLRYATSAAESARGAKEPRDHSRRPRPSE